MGAALKTLGANELNATYTLGWQHVQTLCTIIWNVQVSVTNQEQFTNKVTCVITAR